MFERKWWECTLYKLLGTNTCMNTPLTNFFYEKKDFRKVSKSETFLFRYRVKLRYQGILLKLGKMPSIFKSPITMAKGQGSCWSAFMKEYIDQKGFCLNLENAKFKQIPGKWINHCTKYALFWTLGLLAKASIALCSTVQRTVATTFFSLP